MTQKNNQQQLCLKLNAAIITKGQESAEPTDTIQNTLLPYEVWGRRAESAHRETDDVLSFQKQVSDNGSVKYVAC